MSAPGLAVTTATEQLQLQSLAVNSCRVGMPAFGTCVNKLVCVQWRACVPDEQHMYIPLTCNWKDSAADRIKSGITILPCSVTDGASPLTSFHVSEQASHNSGISAD